MNVNSNIITNPKSNYKSPGLSKDYSKKEEFKTTLDGQQYRSTNKNASSKYSENQKSDKKNNENKSDNVSNIKVKDLAAKETDNSTNNKEVGGVELKQNTEKLSKELVGEDKTSDDAEEIQQMLQSLIFMLQNIPETTDVVKGENELNSTNLESLINLKPSIKLEPSIDGNKLVSKENNTLENKISEIVNLMKTLKESNELSPEIKDMLKSKLNQVISLAENSKASNVVSDQILSVMKKLTSEVNDGNGELGILKNLRFQNISVNSEEKSIKDNLLTELSSQNTKIISEISPNKQMPSSADTSGNNKNSGNSSFEEKFLKSLMGEDKDETKISKAVNFMNQFESVKTSETPKIVASNNLVIDKNNFEVDVIKNIKFMEINNIKNLTVKMNPKELGEVTIRLTMESGIMKASISAQNKETFNLLNLNIQDISDRLKNMDIKIQSLDINIYQDSTFFSKDSSNRNNNENQNNTASTNVDLDEEDISITSDNVIEENQVNEFV
ncbi:flagellar hook-length control protein FliK [Clostridium lacusfryxellense]|uniref:flagellar hook-length control protein FliK n=1 Tax=Clostridium lacusfryxellense TaxID=205328 RepID=UPI001C0C99C3|nr:flagellar hook-length control protein FliK [Clostridium lacusfryxellense]MBU3111785.1 flagellar hook-length control protein FliK [Clostridium lacusfryxellense]